MSAAYVANQKNPDISLHHFPKDPELKKKGLNLLEDLITLESCVCSQHFRDGNPKNISSSHLGGKFASAFPLKQKEASGAFLQGVLQSARGYQVIGRA